MHHLSARVLPWLPSVAASSPLRGTGAARPPPQHHAAPPARASPLGPHGAGTTCAGSAVPRRVPGWQWDWCRWCRQDAVRLAWPSFIPRQPFSPDGSAIRSFVAFPKHTAHALPNEVSAQGPPKHKVRPPAPLSPGPWGQLGGSYLPWWALCSAAAELHLDALWFL